jgi:RNA polymerase sigma-70 factor (ECF subfamily)
MAESAEERERERRRGSKEEQEARQLFDRYVERLVGLARRRISRRLASRVDPEDVVQSVFRTFFSQLKAGRFHIEQQDDLCRLLMRITVRKTLRHIAFHEAVKRSPRLEMGQEDEDQERILELLDHEPTPETTVAFLDQLEHLLNRLHPEERQILEMRLQGYSNDEIARCLGTYDRKIRRVMERIRSLAEQEGISPLGT